MGDGRPVHFRMGSLLAKDTGFDLQGRPTDAQVTSSVQVEDKEGVMKGWTAQITQINRPPSRPSQLNKPCWASKNARM